MQRQIKVPTSRVESAIRRLKELEGIAALALEKRKDGNTGKLKVRGISDTTPSEVARLKRLVSDAGRQVPQTPKLERLFAINELGGFRMQTHLPLVGEPAEMLKAP